MKLRHLPLLRNSRTNVTRTGESRVFGEFDDYATSYYVFVVNFISLYSKKDGPSASDYRSSFKIETTLKTVKTHLKEKT